eukprot:comp22257_c0_seq1/m.32889 comp22257_c0_seq1/g.32889  ORF comp22257_c0_seq1/g.32889 comp22257_c0_seq1/m.32889 type:complete len:402 (-) comp22257_c0_seq1:751-1956(-)
MGRPAMTEATNTASQPGLTTSSPIMKGGRGRGRGAASRSGGNACLHLRLPTALASPAKQKEETHTASQADVGSVSPGGSIASLLVRNKAAAAATIEGEKRDNFAMSVCLGNEVESNTVSETGAGDDVHGAGTELLLTNGGEACPAELATPQGEVVVAEKVEVAVVAGQSTNGEGVKRLQTPAKTPAKGTGKGTRGRGAGRGRGRGRGQKQEPAKSVSAGGEGDGLRQTTMVEHFDVRKSTRRPATLAKKETQQVIQDKIRNRVEDGLVETFEEGKGRGVRATATFQRGDFVCEYYGDLIDRKEAALREQKYAADPSYGCYMYYITHNNKSWCVDATVTTGLGRLINHGKSQANLVSRVVEVDGLPRLSFFARDTIVPGTELLYDYGDRRKDAVKVYPWLAQ